MTEDARQTCPGCGLFDPSSPIPFLCAVCAPIEKEIQK